MLGMARITPISMPAASSIARVLTDAANETSVLLRRERGANLGDQIGHLERLDANQDQVGLLRRGEVVGAHVDAPLRAARKAFSACATVA